MTLVVKNPPARAGDPRDVGLVPGYDGPGSQHPRMWEFSSTVSIFKLWSVDHPPTPKWNVSKKTVLHFGNKGPQDHLKCNRICDFKIESKKTLYQRDQGRSPGGGHGNPFQYSWQDNPKDRGPWWAIVHSVAKSQTRLSDFTFTFSLSCIGEGNGNPLQCSCLENPRDGGAWWAAVCGVTQSWTRLKRLSSSSSSNPKDRGPWWAVVHSVAKSQTWLERLSTAQEVGRWYFSQVGWLT